MRNTLLTLLMMIAVGVSGFAAGRHVQTTTGPQALNPFQTEQAYVVLAKSGTRQQKDASQECLVIPHRDHSQQQITEQESRTMKGLVF
jgi:hypothetical protein